MILKELLSQASLTQATIDRVMQDTGLWDCDATPLLKVVWKSIMATEPVTDPVFLLTAYSVNLYEGDAENPTLRGWYQLCEQQRLYMDFSGIPEYDQVDIWNLEDRRLCDLGDMEVWALLKEGSRLRPFEEFSDPEKALPRLLGARVVESGFLRDPQIAAQVLLEQLIYNRRGITPFAPRYPDRDPDPDAPDWLDAFWQEHRLAGMWRRNFLLFNSISRYQAIREAALAADGAKRKE